jgi:hypothetical protein
MSEKLDAHVSMSGERNGSLPTQQVTCIVLCAGLGDAEWEEREHMGHEESKSYECSYPFTFHQNTYSIYIIHGGFKMSCHKHFLD